MPPMLINAADDERVDVYRQLPRVRIAQQRPQFVVEGRWLVHRLIDSKIQVASILCGQAQAEEFAAVCAEVPLYVAERAVIEQIVGFEFHRGVLACGIRPPEQQLSEVIANANCPALVAVCSGVCDQENLGSVIRNCRAFGVDTLLLDGHCADAYSRRVMRVSAGTALELPIVRSNDLHQELLRLQSERDFKLIASVVDRGAVDLAQSPAYQRMAILFGNEGHGLDERTRQICDHRVTLPMQGGVDSLNVGVASGIFLHRYRQLQSLLIGNCES